MIKKKYYNLIHINTYKRLTHKDMGQIPLSWTLKLITKPKPKPHKLSIEWLSTPHVTRQFVIYINPFTRFPSHLLKPYITKLLNPKNSLNPNTRRP